MHARRWDPQLAAVYYREMVYHGKNHRQAMGAVMSHLGARVLTVLKVDRPYELRDIEGNPVSKEYARKLILSKYHVSEDIRLTGQTRQPKLLNLHKSKLSPQNKSNSEIQGQIC